MTDRQKVDAGLSVIALAVALISLAFQVGVAVGRSACMP